MDAPYEITLDMTGNSGKSRYHAPEEGFGWQNGYEVLTKFLESQNETEILAAARNTVKDAGQAWPGSKVVEIRLQRELAIRLFELLENLNPKMTKGMGNPPDSLGGIRTELIRKLDLKDLKFRER